MARYLLIALGAVALVCSLSQAQEEALGPNGQPKPEPYSFSYSADSIGAQSSRQETGDANGRITGVYTIAGPDGRERRVEYVADADGYRAVVKTNEIGTKPVNSGDAQWQVSQPSEAQLAAANQPSSSADASRLAAAGNRRPQEQQQEQIPSAASSRPSLVAPTEESQQALINLDDIADQPPQQIEIGQQAPIQVQPQRTSVISQNLAPTFQALAPARPQVQIIEQPRPQQIQVIEQPSPQQVVIIEQPRPQEVPIIEQPRPQQVLIPTQVPQQQIVVQQVPRQQVTVQEQTNPLENTFAAFNQQPIPTASFAARQPAAPAPVQVIEQPKVQVQEQAQIQIQEQQQQQSNEETETDSQQQGEAPAPIPVPVPAPIPAPLPLPAPAPIPVPQQVQILSEGKFKTRVPQRPIVQVQEQTKQTLEIPQLEQPAPQAQIVVQPAPQIIEAPSPQPQIIQLPDAQFQPQPPSPQQVLIEQPQPIPIGQPQIQTPTAGAIKGGGKTASGLRLRPTVAIQPTPIEVIRAPQPQPQPQLIQLPLEPEIQIPNFTAERISPIGPQSQTQITSQQVQRLPNLLPTQGLKFEPIFKQVNLQAVGEQGQLQTGSISQQQEISSGQKGKLEVISLTQPESAGTKTQDQGEPKSQAVDQEVNSGDDSSSDNESSQEPETPSTTPIATTSTTTAAPAPAPALVPALFAPRQPSRLVFGKARAQGTKIGTKSIGTGTGTAGSANLVATGPVKTVPVASPIPIATPAQPAGQLVDSGVQAQPRTNQVFIAFGTRLGTKGGKTN